jgi:dipeptidyl-peptidase 4
MEGPANRSQRATRAVWAKVSCAIVLAMHSGVRRVVPFGMASFILASALAGSLGTLAAQSDRASALAARIDRIFKAREFEPPRFVPPRWLDGGDAYAALEPIDGKRSEIARYDAVTGARSVMVSAANLVPAGAAAPLHVDDYAWAKGKLLIFTNTKRVWRRNTRGDYWVLDSAGGRLRRIGANAPSSSLMFAKFSPDGSRVGYVRANNIYVEPTAGGAPVALTRDGSTTTINGTSDWVYEEELGVRDGFRWSPDGARIAYWQFDTTGVGVFTLIDDTSAQYPTTTKFAYPKVGTTNSAVRVGVVAAAGGTTTWIRLPGDPREHYVARMEWIDATTLGIQQLNRLQNQNDFYLADVRTGAARRVFRDRSSSWVEVVEDLRWIDNGNAFLWISERDGWQHVYRVPRDGGEGTLVTRFDADVIDVVGVDAKDQWLYFHASPTDATQRYLYRSRLDATGAPERLTPTDQPGTHAYTLAPGGRFAVHRYSRFDKAAVIDLVELPSHRAVRTLIDTPVKVGEMGAGPGEFLTVDASPGVTLDGWMLKPATFDASRKYPVIVFVYGEPAGQTVTDSWNGATMLFNRALAGAGYVVVSFDNRGTPAPKGAAWRKVVYGSVGDLSSKEQAAAIKALAARHSFIDLDRVGVWGWSGGGSSTLNAMFRFPDIYKVGVAVAPVPDQQLYDTIYQERYMGLPSTNAQGYRAGSPIYFAEGLRGKLLVVHGSGDDNVHFQGTERLVNRLIELGKPFDFMMYPNRTHAIAEGPGTSAHIYQLIARYFVEHLR